MQQLTIEHEDKTTDQKVVENKKAKEKDRRQAKGRVLAISRNVLRILNSDVYYVESESTDNIYYFCKFKPDGFFEWCSCLDNSTRHVKCKHLHAIEFAIKWGTIKDIDKVPLTVVGTTTAADVKIDMQTNLVTKSTVVVSAIGPKSYIDDDYTF